MHPAPRVGKLPRHRRHRPDVTWILRHLYGVRQPCWRFFGLHCQPRALPNKKAGAGLPHSINIFPASLSRYVFSRAMPRSTKNTAAMTIPAETITFSETCSPPNHQPNSTAMIGLT